jgi:fluoroquinolone transport system permease protein
MHDVRLQFRHYFYYAYLFVSLIYIIILRAIPADTRQTAAILVIFTDPSTLGFFFLGGIILLEKGQKTLEGLFVTPLRVFEYMLSKILSLTLLAILSSFLIVVFVIGIRFNPLVFFFGVLLTSVFFILIGFTLASFSKSVNHYLLLSPLYVIVFFLPVLRFLNVLETPFFDILPTTASLTLLEQSFSDISWPGFFLSIINLLVWITIAFLWAYRWFNKYIVLHTGDNK